jgi:hypothetical protein
MKVSEFKQRNRQEWSAVVQSIFPTAVPDSARWTSVDDIQELLSKIARRDLNHMFFPNSGGLDVTAIRRSHEASCLNLMTGTVAYVVRPVALTFDSFAQTPSESYFRLETAGLVPSGVYPGSTNDHEELVELAPGQYHHRSAWDEQNLGEDENGSEIPLPPGSRLVIRFYEGVFLFVAKGSMYNAIPATYDARHNRMSQNEFKSHMAELMETNAGWFEEMENMASAKG